MELKKNKVKKLIKLSETSKNNSIESDVHLKETYSIYFQLFKDLGWS